MAVGALKSERGTVEDFVVEPSAFDAGSFQMIGDVLEGGFTSGTKTEMTQPRRFRGSEFQSAGFVVAPGAEIDRVALAFGLG